MNDAVLEGILAALSSVTGPVEVIGSDRESRRILEAGGHRHPSPEEPPEGVVDLTGEVRALQSAMARLADLGTLVLAGPAGTTPQTLDLYADLHLRGLTMIGVPPAGDELI